MPKGTYKIIATRYHESIPEGVLPLVLGKNKAPWGYKFENNLGKTNPSGDYEQLMKNFVIAQIIADPERTHVSLELCLENLECANLRKKPIQGKDVLDVKDEEDCCPDY